MNNFFNDNCFYPQNFFIKNGADIDAYAVLREISEKAYAISPESFDAETKYFIYKLQYQPPYVNASEFREIKDLQIEAISKTRFKDEYNGYIGIDISEWICHSDEEHFLNCILALRKMSSHWKYLFFADGDFNDAELRRTLDIIKSVIWTKELNSEIFTNIRCNERLTKEITDFYKVRLSKSAIRVIDDIFKERENLTSDIISNIAQDIAMYFRSKEEVQKNDIIAYLLEDTYTRFIMKEKELVKLNILIEKGRIKDDKSCI